MCSYHCTWKIFELIYKFWDSQAFSRNSADLDNTIHLLLYIYVVHECHHSTLTNKNSNTPRL